MASRKKSEASRFAVASFTAVPPAADLFAGGGEMSALMRSTDWSKTKLGPVEDWPQSLKTMLGVVLGSRFPMLLWWGPELLQLYNDAYRPILRDKHPASLAAPAAQVWAEVWDVAGPMARSVQEGGPATWTEDLRLFISSAGMAEETYFTFSYSPVPGDDGAIGGLLNTVHETTAKVQSERQIRMLHDLSARAAEAKTEQEAYRITAEILSTNEPDLPFALLYVLDENGQSARLVAQSGWEAYEGPAKPALIPIGQDQDTTTVSWPLAEVVRTSRQLVVEDLATRFGPLPAGCWHARPNRAIILPLSRAGRSAPHTLVVAGISPHRALDERYLRFFQATADQVAAVIATTRAYEAEKNRAEALAEIDRAKTTFFSNVSHEFRTPLTLLLGPLETLLAEHTLGAETRQRLGQMQRNALRLLRLVNALLDFSRMEAGRHSARFVPTDLARYTADLASAFHSAFEKAGLSFEVDCPPLAEPIYVDRDMWEKIVMNLLSNALKFTFEGGVGVHLAPAPGGARLTVKDSGTGMPRSELPRLFQRFHRVEGARSRSHEGTGIGLALVHELVKLHGGQIRVASEVGMGTEFSIELRSGCAHLPPEHVAESSDTATSVRSAAAYLDEALQWLPYGSQPVASTSATHGARVLVADDNSDLRTFLTSLLAPYYEVQAVADGREALAAVQARKPDLVLSDVTMPNLDGLGLVRALRENPQTRTLPVILLSARAGQEASLEGLAAGADDYLAKPFTSQELLARVRTHLTMAQARDELVTKLTLANEDLKAFSSSVSHDLRAPLRALDGFVSILEEDHAPELNEEARRKIKIIRDSVQRMAVIVEALLALSRIGYQAVQKESFDTDTLVTRICKELTASGEGANADVSVGHLPPTWGDQALLRQVWVNLISNALKYSATRPEARVQITGFDAGEESVFCVKDNGVGFDKSNLDRLFGVFQRLHRSDEFSGTGIGLAIVKRIVDKHRGRVWAEGTLNEGATFFFALPRMNGSED